MRVSRRSAVIIHDLVMITAAWELAWLARFNFTLPPLEFWRANLDALPIVVAVQAFVSWYYGLYRGLWRFASVPDLWNILRAAALGALITTVMLFVVTRLQAVPRSVLVLYPLFLIFLLGAPRLAYRLWKDHSLSLRTLAAGTRVIVVGAGSAGETLVRQMLREASFVPIGFADDKKRLRHTRIHGVPVLGTVDELPALVREHKPDFVIIAIPSASNRQMQRIVAVCEQAAVRFRTLPAARDLATGASYVSELRDVALEDLLGRAKIELDWQGISRGLAGRTVLVTGAGGSIGAELCRQLARLGPARLVVLDQSEFNLFSIDQELRRRFPQLVFSSHLGDVCDATGIEAVLAAHRPEVIFHAAAYKHVPMLQHQVREAVRNNVLGTRRVAEAACRHGCREFVLISTDKAVNPASVMGMCKRVAEMLCESLNGLGDTRFITVRFGNVLDSAGSVVPVFRQQIAAGGPVTVTHPEVTRYFMTIPEACLLIMQAAVLGRGGEIFVLDMGEPVLIRYLAEQMIRLAGREPGRDIDVVYTGLRAGEKLAEELFHDDEASQPTAHAKIRQALHRAVDWNEFRPRLDALLAACERGGSAPLAELLRELLAGSARAPAQDARVVPLRLPNGP
ncbi:MAG: polysaccharide biosynthesis protein [Gammaproteobacteria bacterium]|nr:polysaccharide biosynthesis protein [Gammaproteobacteria bacterium]